MKQKIFFYACVTHSVWIISVFMARYGLTKTFNACAGDSELNIKKNQASNDGLHADSFHMPHHAWLEIDFAWTKVVILQSFCQLRLKIKKIN
jgi:hypothetical protein